MRRTISFVSNVLHERHDNMKWRFASALPGWVRVALSAFAPGDAHGSPSNFDVTTSGGGDGYGPDAAVFGVADSQWNNLSRSTVVLVVCAAVLFLSAHTSSAALIFNDSFAAGNGTMLGSYNGWSVTSGDVAIQGGAVDTQGEFILPIKTNNIKKLHCFLDKCFKIR